MKDPLLTLLQSKARYSDAELAETLNLSADEVGLVLALGKKTALFSVIRLLLMRKKLVRLE